MDPKGKQNSPLTSRGDESLDSGHCPRELTCWLQGSEIQTLPGASRNPSGPNRFCREECGAPGSCFPVPRCSATGFSLAGQGPQRCGAGGWNTPGLNRNQIPSGENRNPARLRAGVVPFALRVQGHGLPGHHLQTLTVSVLLAPTLCLRLLLPPVSIFPGDTGIRLQRAPRAGDWAPRGPLPGSAPGATRPWGGQGATRGVAGQSLGTPSPRFFPGPLLPRGQC